VVYGFGDASRAGFGSSMQRLERLGRLRQFDGSTKLGEKGLRYQIGVWGKDTEHSSSNYREMQNIVESLEDVAEKGDLSWMPKSSSALVLDNSTAESAIYKGTSSNPILYDLVLCLKKLEMWSGSSILVLHVSGKRMIAHHGTDGCCTVCGKAGTPLSLLACVNF
jgi:hypothetical protein